MNTKLRQASSLALAGAKRGDDMVHPSPSICSDPAAPPAANERGSPPEPPPACECGYSPPEPPSCTVSPPEPPACERVQSSGLVFNPEAHSWILVDDSPSHSPRPSLAPSSNSLAQSWAAGDSEGESEADRVDSGIALSGAASAYGLGGETSASVTPLPLSPLLGIGSDEDEVLSAQALSEILAAAWPLPLSHGMSPDARDEDGEAAPPDSLLLAATPPLSPRLPRGCGADEYACPKPPPLAPPPGACGADACDGGACAPPPPPLEWPVRAKSSAWKGAWSKPLVVVAALLASHTAVRAHTPRPTPPQ